MDDDASFGYDRKAARDAMLLAWRNKTTQDKLELTSPPLAISIGEPIVAPEYVNDSDSGTHHQHQERVEEKKLEPSSRANINTLPSTARLKSSLRGGDGPPSSSEPFPPTNKVARQPVVLNAVKDGKNTAREQKSSDVLSYLRKAALSSKGAPKVALPPKTPDLEKLGAHATAKKDVTPPGLDAIFEASLLRPKLEGAREIESTGNPLHVEGVPLINKGVASVKKETKEKVLPCVTKKAATVASVKESKGDSVLSGKRNVADNPDGKKLVSLQVNIEKEEEEEVERICKGDENVGVEVVGADVAGADIAVGEKKIVKDRKSVKQVVVGGDGILVSRDGLELKKRVMITRLPVASIGSSSIYTPIKKEDVVKKKATLTERLKQETDDLAGEQKEEGLRADTADKKMTKRKRAASKGGKKVKAEPNGAATKTKRNRVPDAGRERERELFETCGMRVLCGVDEVGRGPAAGNVTVCAFAMRFDAEFVDGVRDSKKYSGSNSARRIARRRIAELLRKQPLTDYSIATRDAETVDLMGIGRATRDAAREAILTLKMQPDMILMDGSACVLPELDAEHADRYRFETMEKGDSFSYLIAAASVIAKDTRDTYMEEMDKVHPGYGFAEHSGYLVPKHIAAINALGLCAIHRMSWAPIARISHGLPLQDARTSKKPLLAGEDDQKAKKNRKRAATEDGEPNASASSKEENAEAEEEKVPSRRHKLSRYVSPEDSRELALNTVADAVSELATED